MAFGRLDTQRGIVALVLLPLFILSLIFEVAAVKYEYVSPRAQQRRLERRWETEKLRNPLARRTASARPRAVTPRNPPATREAPSHPPIITPAPASPESKFTVLRTLHEKSSLGHDHSHRDSDREGRLRARQVSNESCNLVTITPPGWDGSCSPVDPCPNGACWSVFPYLDAMFFFRC